MTRTKELLFIAVLATFFPCPLAAQEYRLPLSTLLRVADSGSTELRAYRSGTAAAKEPLTATQHGTLLPDVHLKASVGYLGDGYGWGRDSSYSFRVDMPHFSTRFGIDAQQVIYAGGGAKAARRQAELGLHMAELTYEQHRQDLHLQLTGLYMDLYRSWRELEVYDSNIALTERLIANIRVRREQGTALKNDLTRQELQLASLQMQRTRVENNLKIANSRIVTLAGMKSGTCIVPDSSFMGRTDHTLPGNPIAVQMASTKAEMAEQQLIKSRAAMLPYLALIAQDELTGPVTIDITPYDINYNYWFVGVALNYNISSLWKESHTARSARMKQEQATLELQAADEQTKQEIDAAMIRLNEAKRNLTIKKKSLELATQNYALVADRYANDLALLVDMLDAANTKLAAELDIITARIELAYRGFVLDYINGKL